MTWFKIDDNLLEHPKFLQLSDGAQLLWMRAGVWSARYLTEGLIPPALVEKYGRDECAAELVDAGLWEHAEGGFQFHDWLDYQPSKAQVEASRQKTAARVSKHRRNGVSNGVTHGVSNGAPGPGPDPKKERERDARAREVGPDTLFRKPLGEPPANLPPDEPTLSQRLAKRFGELHDALYIEAKGAPPEWPWSGRNDHGYLVDIAHRCEEHAKRIPGLAPSRVGAAVLAAFFEQPRRRVENAKPKFLLADFDDLARNSDSLRETAAQLRVVAT